MQQVCVHVHHSSNMPEGLPAVWEKRACTDGGLMLDLWLRADLPVEVAGHFRRMALRDVCPNIDFDAFTITTEAVPVAAIA